VGLYNPEDHYVYTGEYPVMLIYAAAVLVGLFSAGLGLWLMLSLVRKVRAGQLISRSLFGLILYEPLRKLYHGSGVMRKVILITLAAALVCMTIVGAPVVFGLVLVLGPKYVGKFEAIKEGVRQVNEGNLTHQIPVDPHSSSELDALGREINRIFDSSNKAVQNEIRNQRLKTELISNVSHDLRTPLTSIITYLDLLKSEDLKNERATEYLDVLEKKADRLKQLTDDLFEAAKASSGTMPVDFTTVELGSLIRQTLGEFDRRIQDSRLTFLVAPEDVKYYVRADGQLLYRVMENLVGNAHKYAMPGTRVYISISAHATTGPEVGNVRMVM
jgi:signal transduction histidine kinase